MKYLVIHLLKYTTLTNIYKVVLYNELYIIHCNNIIFVVVKKMLIYSNGIIIWYLILSVQYLYDI